VGCYRTPHPAVSHLQTVAVVVLVESRSLWPYSAQPNKSLSSDFNSLGTERHLGGAQATPHLSSGTTGSLCKKNCWRVLWLVYRWEAVAVTRLWFSNWFPGKLGIIMQLRMHAGVRPASQKCRFWMTKKQCIALRGKSTAVEKVGWQNQYAWCPQQHLNGTIRRSRKWLLPGNYSLAIKITLLSA
jgi:hypothetical protein